MLRYALVLFDEDGCTAVVESSKIRSDTEVQTSLLELSDSKVELNSFENTWSKSHRSRALDAAKRGGQIGGYLSVWPEDAETEEPQNSGSDGQDSSSKAENEEKQSRKRRKTESKRMVKEKKKSDKKPKKTSKSQGTSAVTDNNTDTQQNTTITGTNSRKITVLYEGSGDYSGQDPKLESPPFYTFHLSQDQTDILQ